MGSCSVGMTHNFLGRNMHGAGLVLGRKLEVKGQQTYRNTTFYTSSADSYIGIGSWCLSRVDAFRRYMWLCDLTCSCSQYTDRPSCYLFTGSCCGAALFLDYLHARIAFLGRCVVVYAAS